MMMMTRKMVKAPLQGFSAIRIIGLSGPILKMRVAVQPSGGKDDDDNDIMKYH